jgi:chaperonin GroES
MVIKPINNYVLGETLPIKSPKSTLIPDNMEINQRWAKVKEVGPGVPHLGSKLIPPTVNPGNFIYVMAHGKEPLYGDDNLGTFIVSELDILAYSEEINENMKIYPLGNFISIDKDPPANKTSVGLLKLSNQTDPPATGTVTALGKGWVTLDGAEIPFQVKVGDKVMFRPYNTVIVDLSTIGIDKKVTLISHGDILGVITDEHN